MKKSDFDTPKCHSMGNDCLRVLLKSFRNTHPRTTPYKTYLFWEIGGCCYFCCCHEQRRMKMTSEQHRQRLLCRMLHSILLRDRTRNCKRMISQYFLPSLFLIMSFYSCCLVVACLKRYRSVEDSFSFAFYQLWSLSFLKFWRGLLLVLAQYGSCRFFYSCSYRCSRFLCF